MITALEHAEMNLRRSRDTINQRIVFAGCAGTSGGVLTMGAGMLLSGTPDPSLRSSLGLSERPYGCSNADVAIETHRYIASLKPGEAIRSPKAITSCMEEGQFQAYALHDRSTVVQHSVLGGLGASAAAMLLGVAAYKANTWLHDRRIRALVGDSDDHLEMDRVIASQRL